MSDQHDRLLELLREAHAAGNPYASDVATHAAILVGNGWSADEALRESKQTLDDAELEGGY